MRTAEDIARVWCDAEQRRVGGENLLNAIRAAQNEAIEAAAALMETDPTICCDEYRCGEDWAERVRALLLPNESKEEG